MHTQAKVKLQQNVVGGAVAFLEAGGMHDFNSQIIALLGCITTTFQSVGDEVRDFCDELLLKIGGIWSVLVGLCLSIFTELLRASSCSVKWSLEQLIRTLQLFSKSLKILEYPVRSHYLAPMNVRQPEDDDSRRFSWRRLGDVSQKLAANLKKNWQGYADSPEESLEEWQLVEDKSDKDVGPDIDCGVEHIQALFDELNHLIDHCGGLSSTQWDGILGALGDELVEREERELGA